MWVFKAANLLINSEYLLLKDCTTVCLYETEYSRMNQVIFAEDSLKNWSDMVCLSRPYPYPLKFFKGCLPQILHGPFLNTLPHMWRTKKAYHNDEPKILWAVNQQTVSCLESIMIRPELSSNSFIGTTCICLLGTRFLYKHYITSRYMGCDLLKVQVNLSRSSGWRISKYI